MTRLPVPGSDDGAWGSVLSDFLMVEYNEDGSLRDVARSSELDSKADDTAVVHKSGAETISGTKTLNASPVIPESYNDNHAATKSYVDSSTGAGAPDATGTLRAAYSLAGSSSGEDYTNKMDYTVVQGSIGEHFALMPAPWDEANSRWRITIAHRTPGRANYASVRVAWQCESPELSEGIRTSIGLSESYSDDTNPEQPLAAWSKQSIVTVDESYSITPSDSIVVADASSGALTVTLPSSVGMTGKTYTVKRVSSGAGEVVVATTNPETIDGASAYSELSTQWATVTVVSNGANWLTV